MSEESILSLIEFSPSNLKDFFDKAVIEETVKEEYSYGILRKSPVTYLMNDGTSLVQKELDQMVIPGVKDIKNSEPL